MHGENEQKRPLPFSMAAALGTTSHGLGRSKMAASASAGTLCANEKPASHTSPCKQLTSEGPKPFAANSRAAYLPGAGTRGREHREGALRAEEARGAQAALRWRARRRQRAQSAHRRGGKRGE